LRRRARGPIQSALSSICVAAGSSIPYAAARTVSRGLHSQSVSHSTRAEMRAWDACVTLSTASAESNEERPCFAAVMQKEKGTADHRIVPEEDGHVDVLAQTAKRKL
jgi:hypothetical protein